MPLPRRPRSANLTARGFTLIEILIVVVIVLVLVALLVGIGVAVHKKISKWGRSGASSGSFLTLRVD